jgi:hypothetical protein
LVLSLRFLVWFVTITKLSIPSTIDFARRANSAPDYKRRFLLTSAIADVLFNPNLLAAFARFAHSSLGAAKAKSFGNAQNSR